MSITQSGTSITFNDSTTQGTGVPTPSANGQIPIANSSNQYTNATLTAGTAISITNGSGTISVANSGVTSVAAGTGISVSGTTGSVTISSTVASLPGVLGQLFTSSGTFTIPSGVTALKVTVIGGGGGGGNGTSSGYIGGNGGSSTVASGTQTISTITGGGGLGGYNSGATGAGSGGTINFTGNQYNGSGYGANGTGAVNGTPGGQAIKYLTGLTSGNTLAVTIGSGGSGTPPHNCCPSATAGQAGMALIEW